MTDIAAAKAAARAEAKAVRADAHAARGADPAGPLREVLAGHSGTVALYAPIGTEIDPLPAGRAVRGGLALPVVVAPSAPLRFRAWDGGALRPGAFGVPVPAAGEWRIPGVVVVPMLAFDRTGRRLGYGGGFYDRTLAALRASRAMTAIGFAYAAQEVREVPAEATDAPLDLIVTEAGRLSIDERCGSAG